MVEWETSYVLTCGGPSSTLVSNCWTSGNFSRLYDSAFSFCSQMLMPTASAPFGFVRTISCRNLSGVAAVE